MSFGSLSGLPKSNSSSISEEVVFDRRDTTQLYCSRFSKRAKDLLSSEIQKEIERANKTNNLEETITRLVSRAFKDFHLGFILGKGGTYLKIKDHYEMYVHDGMDTTLALLDVDDLKKYNDLHGHKGGDDALEALTRSIHALDYNKEVFVTRLGGDEFVVFSSLGPNELKKVLVDIQQKSEIGFSAGIDTISNVYSKNESAIDNAYELLSESQKKESITENEEGMFYQVFVRWIIDPINELEKQAKEVYGKGTILTVDEV